MKDVLMFYLDDCGYCRNARLALDELFAETPAYRDLKITKIEESREPELADRYDYYAVPSFFVDGEKRFEGAYRHALRGHQGRREGRAGLRAAGITEHKGQKQPGGPQKAVRLAVSFPPDADLIPIPDGKQTKICGTERRRTWRTVQRGRVMVKEPPQVGTIPAAEIVLFYLGIRINIRRSRRR